MADDFTLSRNNPWAPSFDADMKGAAGRTEGIVGTAGKESIAGGALRGGVFGSLCALNLPVSGCAYLSFLESGISVDSRKRGVDGRGDASVMAYS